MLLSSVRKNGHCLYIFCSKANASFRLADVPLATLRDAALDLKLGGVGFYPGSNFVHVDTGRVRSWGG